jgi:hypothetical protein
LAHSNAKIAKEVLSQEQKKVKHLQQHREHNLTRRASAPSIKLTEEQKKENCLQKKQESAAKKRKEASTSKNTKGSKNQASPLARPPHTTRTQGKQSLETFLKERVRSGSQPTLNLDDFPETQDHQEKFAGKMNFFLMFWCKSCKEGSFTKVKSKSIPGECKDCEYSKKRIMGLQCSPL